MVGGEAPAAGVAARAALGGAGAGSARGGRRRRGGAGGAAAGQGAAGPRGGPSGGRRLSFVHPLVRESVYAELSAGDRARGHARAAQLLTEAGADAERVAIHRHEGDPAGDPEAVRVLREAAASARRRGATEVALSHLRRALREPPTPEDERLVKRELGAVELQSAQYDAAAEHLAAAAAGDPRVAAELGAALQLANRPVESVAALSRAIDALTDDQQELGLHAAGHARRRLAGQPRGGGRSHASRASGSARTSTRPRRPASSCSSPASPTARR